MYQVRAIASIATPIPRITTAMRASCVKSPRLTITMASPSSTTALAVLSAATSLR